MEDLSQYSTPWPNLDELGFEAMGLPRNLFFGAIAGGFIFYNILNATWGKTLSGMAGMLPLFLTIFLWARVVIPALRDMNDKLPAGYWKGIYDYYLLNPSYLEIVNDPEPMPTYLRQSVLEPNQPNQRPS